MSIGSQWDYLVSFVRGKDATTAQGLYCWICKNKPLEDEVCTHTLYGRGKEQCLFECVRTYGRKDGGFSRCFYHIGQ